MENGKIIAIYQCTVEVRPLSQPIEAGTPITPEPAVYVQGDMLRIEENTIFAVEADAANRGFGGLHIGGDSHDVEIRRNNIRGGNNNGITLGSVVRRVVDEEFRSHWFYRDAIGFRITIDDEGCVQVDPIPPTGDDGEPTVEFEPGPPLFDIRIIDNLIEKMGMSGISVARFFEMETSPDFISVIGLVVAENRIRECMRLEVGDLPTGLRDVIGFGGVALADVDYFVLRDNTIQKNGAASVDPISGVFLLHGTGIAIDRNFVLDNGMTDSEDNPLRPGRRGGIVIGLARAPVGPEIDVNILVATSTGFRQTGFPAAHVHDNVVVSPAGRALEVIALGPVSVEGNEFTAKGSIIRFQTDLTTGASDTKSASFLAGISYSSISGTSNPLLAFLDLLGGSAILIFNLGVSNEIYLQLIGLSGLFLLDDLPASSPEDDDERFFVGGNILFNNNQVVFDAFASGFSFTLSSILLISLDDISMEGNQCDCDLLIDFALLNALVLGWSIRVAENRLKEGLFNTFYSGLTLGLMNQTADNQSTHCLYTLGPSITSNFDGNRALVELFSKNACGRFRDRLVGVYGAQMVSAG